MQVPPRANLMASDRSGVYGLVLFAEDHPFDLAALRHFARLIGTMGFALPPGDETTKLPWTNHIRQTALHPRSETRAAFAWRGAPPRIVEAIFDGTNRVASAMAPRVMPRASECAPSPRNQTVLQSDLSKLSMKRCDDGPMGPPARLRPRRSSTSSKPGRGRAGQGRRRRLPGPATSSSTSQRQP